MAAPRLPGRGRRGWLGMWGGALLSGTGSTSTVGLGPCTLTQLAGRAEGRSRYETLLRELVFLFSLEEND